MHVWEVFGKRTPADRFVLAGTIKAPDAEMAVILARETHFRHKEGVQYAVRRRGDTRLHVGPYEADVLGGLTDRSYRRSEAYSGVGARLKRVAADMALRGLTIDRPRPPVGRLRGRPDPGMDAAPAAGAEEMATSRGVEKAATAESDR